MAKKGVKYYIPGAIALVFGIAAFCMMFLEGVKYSADLIIAQTSYSYTGAQLAFGYAEESVTILSFNFMAFIAFLLPVIGGLIAVLFKNGLITKIVSTACFVVGAVFLFSMVGFATIGMSTASKAMPAMEPSNMYTTKADIMEVTMFTMSHGRRICTDSSHGVSTVSS